MATEEEKIQYHRLAYPADYIVTHCEEVELGSYAEHGTIYGRAAKCRTLSNKKDQGKLMRKAYEC
jgi:hypothetical protein